MFYKLQDEIFTQDIFPLLPQDIMYDTVSAYWIVYEKLISHLTGTSWQGMPDEEKDKRRA